MATVTVRTPVEGFQGEVAGVHFEDGKAEVERGTAAFRYFLTSGYRIEGQPEPDPTPEPPDPREVGTDGDGIVVVGTRLRDAAVDPRPTDFLPPTNAGQANPHGSLVVSPGLHASETGPIAPGAVSSDPGTQQGKETALAEAVFVEGRSVIEATADVPDDVPHGTEDAADAASAVDVTYTGSSVDQLRAELKYRELPTSGTKSTLIERLREHDRQTGRDASITLDVEQPPDDGR